MMLIGISDQRAGIIFIIPYIGGADDQFDPRRINTGGIDKILQRRNTDAFIGAGRLSGAHPHSFFNGFVVNRDAAFKMQFFLLIY